MFGFLFNKRKLVNSAHQLFSSIIEQSRIQTFYSHLGVNDNFDGRFDIMAVHMVMVIDKLDGHGEMPDCAKIKRMLQEAMFDNLDLTLREIGVGDLGVGKKIKVIAEAFYGRMMVYQDLFQGGDKKKMSEALHLNLYRQREIDDKLLNHMSTYVFDQKNHIKEQSIENVMSGKITFIVPKVHSND